MLIKVEDKNGNPCDIGFNDENCSYFVASIFIRDFILQDKISGNHQPQGYLMKKVT